MARVKIGRYSVPIKRSAAHIEKLVMGRKASAKKIWDDLSAFLEIPVKDLKNLKGKFREQKYNAAGRQIDFNFTFVQWIDCWKKSGKLAKRGFGKGKYVMSRKGDIGSYSLENVEIILFEDNLAAQIENINRSPEYRSRMSIIMKRVRAANKK